MHTYIIVDDEHLIRKGIRMEVETSGLELSCVGEAGNGEEALQLIRDKDPHIILTDMRMPVSDGRYLLKILQQEYPGKKIIVISGFSDFEYMQEAISASVVGYLLKPYNDGEIHKTLSKAVTSLEKDKSVQEKIEKVETIVKEKESIESILDSQMLLEILLSAKEVKSLPPMKTPRLEKLVAASWSAVAVLSSKKEMPPSIPLSGTTTPLLTENCIYLVNPSNPQMSFILYGCDHLDSQVQVMQFHDTVKQIAAHIEYLSQSRITTGISSMVPGFKKTGQAYLEALAALDSQKIHMPVGILIHGEVQGSSIQLNWPHYTQLSFFMESGNLEKSLALVSDFFGHFSEFPTITLREVKNNCQDLFDHIRILAKRHTDAIGTSGTSSYEIIKGDLFDLESIEQYFIQLVSNITQLLKGKNIYPANQLAYNIKSFVDGNYCSNISLGQITEMFYISPSYCSTLFKEITGETFTDYINRHRIAKGKELLESSAYPVYKIAKKLGFKNTKYFFRVFKKATGLTPLEYKSNLGK